jgi:hypothetical protein
MKIAKINVNQIIENRGQLDCFYNIIEDSKDIYKERVRANHFPELLDKIFALSKEYNIRVLQIGYSEMASKIINRNNMEHIFDTILN